MFKKTITGIAFIISAVMLVMAFTACNNNGDNSNNGNDVVGDSELVAKWYTTQALAQTNGDDWALDIKAGGVIVFPAGGSVSGQRTYTVEDGRIMVFQGNEEIGAADYTITATTLTFGISKWGVFASMTMLYKTGDQDDPGFPWSPPQDPSRQYVGNPIVTSIYSADPSAHVWPTHPDRIFLYPSQDIAPPNGCDLMDRYHVFSSDNMFNWVNHGEIVRRMDLHEKYPSIWGNSMYEGAYFMWAPDAAYSTSAPGKGPYFFYFPVALGGTGNVGPGESWGENWHLGVAWSDRPEGGFLNNEIVKLTYKDDTPIKGGGRYIDPSIFYDEDTDTHYLVVGGSQEMRIARLNKNMVSLDEDFHVFTSAQIPRFHEGPWMFARTNDAGVKLYYLMHAFHSPTPGTGGHLAYAISTEGPYGPWTYKDSILGAVTGDTNHGSIVEFKGQWYLFYHTNVRSGGNLATGGTGGVNELRSTSVDQLFFNRDGTIRQVLPTSYGVPAIGPPSSEAALNAEFGAGNWTMELPYAEYLQYIEDFKNSFKIENTTGYTHNADYMVQGLTVLTVGNLHGGYVYDYPSFNVVPQDVLDAAGVVVYQATHSAAQSALQNFHNSGAYAEFRNISGGTGGEALLEVYFGSDRPGSTRLEVNDVEVEYMEYVDFNATGGWETYTGKTLLRINLESGDNNTIRFSRVVMNITGIKIYFKN